MKVFTGGRGAGNTTVLVQQASRFGYPIICPSYCSKIRIQEIAEDLGIECPQVFTYDDVKNGHARGYRFDTVCVSDFNLILLRLLRDNDLDVNIDSVSASLE